MTWFAGVPLEIEVGRARLIRAEQAIEDAQAANSRYDESPVHFERPSSDWVASQVLDLARLQLQELRRVIEEILGVDQPIVDLDDVRARLRTRAAVLPEPDRNEAEYNVDSTQASQLRISEDALKEVIIYQRTMDNTMRAIKELEKEGVKIFRPIDYFAEMFKSDSHMKIITKKLEYKNKEIVNREQNQKNKLQKKYQKNMKHRKQIEEAKEKSKNLRAIEEWKTSIRNKEGKGLDHFISKAGPSRDKFKRKPIGKGSSGGKGKSKGPKSAGRSKRPSRH